ncbi:hypothetical protein, partial [Bacteroides stercorirosoris]
EFIGLLLFKYNRKDNSLSLINITYPQGFRTDPKYARKAVRQQGAEMALFQFDEWNDDFRKQLLILKKEGIKAKYFITGENEVHSL